MKKSFTLGMSILFLILMFTMVVNASNEQINGICEATIVLKSSYLDMKSTLDSGLSPTLIKNIQAMGEFFRNDVSLANLGTSDTGGVRSKSVSYGATLISGYYEVVGFGTYVSRTMPDVTYYDDDITDYYYDASGRALEKERVDMRRNLDLFAIKVDNYVANTLNIPLQNYKKADIFRAEKTDSNTQLVRIFFEIPIEIGDRKPSFYLKNNREGVVLMQKYNGMNVAYHLEYNDSKGWFISSEVKRQGVIMDFDTTIAQIEKHNVSMDKDVKADVQKTLTQFREALSNQIASSLDISLEDYQVKEIFNSDEIIKDKLTLLKLNKGLSIETGDKKPSYFFKNDTEGVVLIQKADATNIVHFIEYDEESWRIKETKTVQGTPMSMESSINN